MSRTMGRLFFELLDNKAYACRNCGCQLAQVEELVSKQFHSKNGRAYLFNNVVNVQLGPKETRQMVTGQHIVRDTFCRRCMFPIGWKYEEARCTDQRYKEGKYILERSKMLVLQRETRSVSRTTSQSANVYDSDGEWG